MSVAATILVVLVVALWGLAVYKRLVRERAAVLKAWTRVEEARGRRREAGAALANAVASAPTHSEAAAAVLSAVQNAAASRGPTDAGVREDAVSAALGKLLAAVDREPTGSRAIDLRHQLAAAEEALAAARTSYNATAATYNRAIAAAPDNLVAGLVSYSPAERFETRRSE